MRLIDADQFGVISFQGKSEDFIEGVAFMFDKIHEAPTIDRPRGRWVTHDRPSLQYGCNICGNLANINSNFCPNCGAPMTEEAFRKYNGLKEGKSGYDYNVQNPCETCKNVGDCEPCEKMKEGEKE